MYFIRTTIQRFSHTRRAQKRETFLYHLPDMTFEPANILTAKCAFIKSSAPTPERAHLLSFCWWQTNYKLNVALKRSYFFASILTPEFMARVCQRQMRTFLNTFFRSFPFLCFFRCVCFFTSPSTQYVSAFRINKEKKLLTHDLTLNHPLPCREKASDGQLIVGRKFTDDNNDFEDEMKLR